MEQQVGTQTFDLKTLDQGLFPIAEGDFESAGFSDCFTEKRTRGMLPTLGMETNEGDARKEKDEDKGISWSSKPVSLKRLVKWAQKKLFRWNVAVEHG